MVIISGKTRKKFLVTRGVLQEDTLAQFVFIIVLDYILSATESSNCGVKTQSIQLCNTWSLLTTLCYWILPVLLLWYVTSLRQNNSAVRLNININFQETKAMFISCEPDMMSVKDNTYTYTQPFYGFLDFVAWWAGTRMVKPMWILLKARDSE